MDQQLKKKTRSFQFTQEVSTTILDGVHFLLLR